MELKLNGKKAIVTGSSAGIGFSIAELLANEGADVIITGRNQARIDNSIERIMKDGGLAKGIKVDVSTVDGVNALIKEVPQVDILVNNVGIYEPKDFFEITDDEWLNIFNINVMSGIRLSRHYMTNMLKQNWGRIIFISSESGVNIPAEMIHYGMTKTAQISVARGLAELTSGTNVTVNTVLPGPTRSQGVEEFIKDMAKSKSVSEVEVEKEFFKEIRPSSLIQRFATCEEVANMVAYVASERASATNGAALRVEGGCIKSAF